MLVPSIFANSVFDDFFDFPYVNDKKTERKLYGHNAANLMKTDIQEYDDGYQLEIDLPGFKKDEVHAELKDGYLVVNAEKGLDEDEQDKKTGKYLRRERYAGSCQRTGSKLETGALKSIVDRICRVSKNRALRRAHPKGCALFLSLAMSHQGQ